MFAFIKHAINLAKHTFRDVGTGSKRSPKWKSVEKVFLSLHGSCAVCGETDKKLLAVHHISPFHVHPQLELDLSSLITLCVAKDRWHHLHVGHLGDFNRWNPNVGHVSPKRAIIGVGVYRLTDEQYSSRLRFVKKEGW